LRHLRDVGAGLRLDVRKPNRVPLARAASATATEPDALSTKAPVQEVPRTDVQLMYIEQGTGRGSKQRPASPLPTPQPVDDTNATTRRTDNAASSTSIGPSSTLGVPTTRSRNITNSRHAYARASLAVHNATANAPHHRNPLNTITCSTPRTRERQPHQPAPKPLTLTATNGAARTPGSAPAGRHQLASDPQPDGCSACDPRTRSALSASCAQPIVPESIGRARRTGSRGPALRPLARGERHAPTSCEKNLEVACAS
jgi:hypothetical protein